MTRVLFGVARKEIEKKEEPVIPQGMGSASIAPREPVVDADPGDETTEEVKD